MVKKIIGVILMVIGLIAIGFGGYGLIKGIGGLEGIFYLLAGAVFACGGLAVLAGDQLKDTIEGIFTSIQF